jgi:hypothetical protein
MYEYVTVRSRKGLEVVESSPPLDSRRLAACVLQSEDKDKDNPRRERELY